ncbi:MAG: arginine--tRNA ligase [Ruminococcus bromii]|nr:arginine--tRNA ligase [Ruminococcus bromii]MCI7212057.1 arginine--tRNA ligase [Ruminococcus bromii]MDD6433697.1 arginine--tRNA ligase [Ruminococcus bromii]MDY4085560.1 arginine--tRNA ligase [Ruminococcus bromii]MDY4710634.1 arginine--tRNA ligase [Ruminococcus bromii]
MDMYAKAVESLKSAITNAINKAIENGELPKAEIPEFIIETPADTTHGDFATNAAMAGAKSFRMPPFKIAQAITANLDLSNTVCERFETAGPGFINFFLGSDFYSGVVEEILSNPEDYGKSDFGKGENVMVEFVSANPTGPMHMGNARGGALGDCLAAVLDKAGYNAYREFYVNDAGNQIEKFGCSLEARYLQIFKGDEIEFPEDGYQGADITDLANEYKDIYGDKLLDVSSEERRKALVDYALPKNIKKMQEDMAAYKITYDKWFFESELHKSGAVKEVIDILTSKGLTYEKEGAIWYKNKEVLTQKFLKEGKSQKYIDNLELKDDVLVRKNGNPTYFAADIAYHKNKFDRGFTTLIDIWGADHHGHVMRMKGAMDAVGYDGSKLNVVLMQLVKLVKGGELVKMSKRTGKAIQLRDLLEEVPVDSARFLFNTREANTQMDFDLDLAVTQDNQNPVYYVQYAHARICSIFKALAKDGIAPRKCTSEELALLTTSEEKELISHLALYSSEIVSAAKDYDPTKITRYVTKTATLFHKFYNACRVKGEDESLMQARLALCDCTRAVIKNVLTMFNISCPDSM